MPDYPFVPRTNATLVPGQFWSIPLTDGRFACGRVLAVDRTGAHGARTMFVAGLLDWVGSGPPTPDTIAGSSILDVGRTHVRVIAESGGAVLGERPLVLDAIVVPADVGTFWGARYPALRAEQRFVSGVPPHRSEMREIRSPMTAEMLEPSPTGEGVVQFSKMPSDDELKRLGEWFGHYPAMRLRAYGSYDGSIRDLEFLRFFPTLRHFEVDAVHDTLHSSDGLRFLPDDLQSLAIGWTKRKLDLAVLGRFGQLRTLYLEGQTRHIEVVSSLTSLEDLTLRSITLPDLSLLVPLERMLSLDIKLGGTRELGLLPDIGQLRYLELWLIKGLSDISAVGRLAQLRYLFLQALKQVDSLPDLSECVALRRVHLETMKGLHDLGPLTTAPALEEVVLADMRQLRPEDLRPLASMPHLKAVAYGLGSWRKRAEARAIVGLPEVESHYDWRDPQVGA